MRKWFVILMTAVGMTLFMLLGMSDIGGDRPPLHSGERAAPVFGAPDEAAEPRVALSAVVSMDARSFEALRRATDRYAAARPNVAVALRNVEPGEMNAMYEAGVETGSAPDVLLLPTERVRLEAAAGRLQALDDYVAAERQSQWFETVRGAVRWNGYLWAVPFDWDPYVFAVRADSPLAKKTPATAEEWVAAAGSTQAAVSDAYGTALLRDWSGGGEAEAAEKSSDGPAPASGSAEEAAGEASAEEGGAPLASAGVAAEASESTDSGEDAAEEAQAEGDARAGVAESSEPAAGPVEAVLRGDAAWALVRLSEAAEANGGRGELAVAPFVAAPEASGALPPFAGRSFAVSASSQHPAEAAEWIRYLMEDATLEGHGLLETSNAGGWPVYRSYYGLPASALGGAPAVLGSASGAASAYALGALAEDGADGLRLGTIMRRIDNAYTPYGALPEELPAAGY
ncbi:hypothetical protein [Paenibacillus sp.]|uniref:hypothetical protein n=1 Tax=Paenibacillus sp. TaxID=58172 RepID=UPI002D5740B4|nr:hypothetical protein [Paenibacillus sp.]HZG88285.1 hypothetical protein [Paenibacillus sp.]